VESILNLVLVEHMSNDENIDLSVILSAIQAVGQRLDDFKESTDRRFLDLGEQFKSMEKETVDRFDKVESRLSGLESSMNDFQGNIKEQLDSAHRREKKLKRKINAIAKDGRQRDRDIKIIRKNFSGHAYPSTLPARGGFSVPFAYTGDALGEREEDRREDWSY